MKKKREAHLIKAAEGDIIQFQLNDVSILGKVVIVRENSVITEIERSVAIFLDIENNRTVVSHQRYEIIKKTKQLGRC